LLLLRQTSVPTVLDSFYLATLGSYRFFYVLNWLVRAVRDQDIDVVSVVFGLIQTALYLDFAWVYWTRQRVKLRGGSVVDSDDLGKGWLVRRFANVRREVGGDGDDDTNYNDYEQNSRTRPENGADSRATIRPGTNGVVGKGRKALGGIMRGGWRNKPGSKGGMSISADDGVHDIEAGRHADDDLAPPDQFEDDIGDDDVAIGDTPVKQSERTSRYEDDEDLMEAPKKETTPPLNINQEQEEENVAIGSNADAVLVGDGSEWRDGGEGRHV
jgi:ER lumen protein retaining receptor